MKVAILLFGKASPVWIGLQELQNHDLEMQERTVILYYQMKTNMRKLLLLSIVGVLFAVASCKKDNSNNNNPTVPGTITVEINGVPDSFNTNAFAVDTINGHEIHIRGNNNGIGATFDEVSFYIDNSTPITVAPYSNVGFFYEEGSGTNDFQAMYGGPFTDTIGATITSIDSTTIHRVKGTFSGQVIDIPFNGMPNIVDTFTNGRFDLPLSNH